MLKRIKEQKIRPFDKIKLRILYAVRLIFAIKTVIIEMRL